MCEDCDGYGPGDFTPEQWDKLLDAMNTAAGQTIDFYELELCDVLSIEQLDGLRKRVIARIRAAYETDDDDDDDEDEEHDHG